MSDATPPMPVACERFELMIRLPSGGFDYVNIIRPPAGYTLRDGGGMIPVRFRDGSSLGVWCGSDAPAQTLVARPRKKRPRKRPYVHKRYRFASCKSGEIVEVDVMLVSPAEWEALDPDRRAGFSPSTTPDGRVLAVKLQD